MFVYRPKMQIKLVLVKLLDYKIGDAIYYLHGNHNNSCTVCLIYCKNHSYKNSVHNNLCVIKLLCTTNFVFNY